MSRVEPRSLGPVRPPETRPPGRLVVQKEQFRYTLAKLPRSVALLYGVFALLAVGFARALSFWGWPAAAITFGWIIHGIMILLSAAWAVAIWQDESPRQRLYFWLQPYPRPSHIMARCVAGVGLLGGAIALGGLVLFVAIGLLGDPSTVGEAEGGIPLSFMYWALWAQSLLLAYLLASVAGVASDRPSVWLLALPVSLLVIDLVAELQGIQWLDAAMRPLFDAPLSLSVALMAPERWLLKEVALQAPDPAARLTGVNPEVAVLLWLGIASVLVILSAKWTRPRA